MIILKLGGSVITKKEATKPTVDYDNLNRISKEIAASSYGKLIIVHGAGSFGHPMAKKYAIGSASKNQEEFDRKKFGFCTIQNSVKKLNSIICDHLRRQKIFAVSIHPSSFVLTKNKRIYSANLDLIRRYLDLDFVPVIFGDVVLDLDESIKMAVLSGDQIIKYLGENLKPQKVILGSDVDGIHTKDPKKYPDAKLLNVVTSLEELETTEDITSFDVTGGMVGKVHELLQLADRGIESEILDASKPNLIKKALNGEKVEGTLIKKIKQN